MLVKPQSIANSPFKSAKWDEVTEGREFKQSDAPTLALLCQWYEVIEQCMSDISVDGQITVAYMNELGDLKAYPQLSTMKQASAEIRAINKQLGIEDEAKPQEIERKVVPLSVIQANRRSKTKDRGRAEKAV